MSSQEIEEIILVAICVAPLVAFALWCIGVSIACDEEG